MSQAAKGRTDNVIPDDLGPFYFRERGHDYGFMWPMPCYSFDETPSV